MNGYDFVISLFSGIGVFVFFSFLFFGEQIVEIFKTWCNRKK